MGNMIKAPLEEDTFSFEDMEFKLENLANGKFRDIKGYQDKIFKMGGSIIILHVHKLLNFAVKHDFPKTWTRSLIVPIFKIGDENIPFNYRTIIISHILAKLYGLIFEKKIRIWVGTHGKRAKWKASFRRHHSTIGHFFTLSTILEECRNSKIDIFSCFVDFRKAFGTIPCEKLWKRLEEIMVPLNIGLYLGYKIMLLLHLRPPRVSLRRLKEISELRKDVS